MKEFFVLVVVYFLNTDALTVNHCNYIKDYYWRDFDGKIPEDALKGSKLDNGQLLYIGQALNPGFSLTPGYIKANNPNVFYEYATVEHSISEDSKILCTRHPQKYLWKLVKENDFVAVVSEGELVVGGHDAKRPLVVGKVSTTQGEMVGKVLILGNKFGLIYYGDNGKGFTAAEYYVLVYDNCKKSVIEEKVEECKERVVNLNFY